MKVFFSVYKNPNTNLVDFTGKVTSHHFSSICHASTQYFPKGVSDGGLSCDIVDWEESYRCGFNFTTKNTVVNAFAFKSLQLLSELAMLIPSRKQEARMLKMQATKTREAMLTFMYDNKTRFF